MSLRTHGFRTGAYRTREARSGNGTSATEAAGDGRGRSKSSRRRVGTGLVVAAAALYSWFAALTTPFTSPADVMTGIPLILALLLALRFAYQARSQPRSRPASGRSASGQARSGPTRAGPWPWWSAFGLIAAWELFCYFGLPRYAHPTISSLYDSASRVDPVKAALFLGWLGLGWAIVRSFRRAGP